MIFLTLQIGLFYAYDLKSPIGWDCPEWLIPQTGDPDTPDIFEITFSDKINNKNKGSE